MDPCLPLYLLSTQTVWDDLSSLWSSKGVFFWLDISYPCKKSSGNLDHLRLLGLVPLFLSSSAEAPQVQDESCVSFILTDQAWCSSHNLCQHCSCRNRNIPLQSLGYGSSSLAKPFWCSSNEFDDGLAANPLQNSSFPPDSQGYASLEDDKHPWHRKVPL